MTTTTAAAAAATTTTQLQLTKEGGPFQIAQASLPVLEPDMVLIRQRVIALNLIDAKQRDLGLMIQHWPRVLGVEGGGVIESVGSEVHNLQRGDEVVGWQGSGAMEPVWGGSFQELVIVPARFLAKKPSNLSFEEAASLPCCFATAVAAIVGTLRIPLPFLPATVTEGAAPSSILILGGSSATGAAAIQLLRMAYPGPSLQILATSSPKHFDHLVGLGADVTADYKSPDHVDFIKKKSLRGVGVDMIVDCVSAGATQTNICDVFDPNGPKKYATVITGVSVTVPEGVQKEDATMSNIMHMPGGDQVFPSLTKLVENGSYKVPLPVRVVGHGLDQLATALDEVNRVSGEKLVVRL